VTNVSLAKAYLIKSQKRLKVLPALLAEDAYSDVIREAQEIVELALKGMLRQVGIEPPRWHDVGALLQEYRLRFPSDVATEVDRLAEISGWARDQSVWV
jgi:HEPN domain-containing protein